MAKPTPRRHANEPKPQVKTKIRKNDTVKVITGRDKGKTGRVIEVISEKGRLVVEGVMMIKKHMRPNPQKQIKGGIAERESTIHISNVMLLTAGGIPTRVGMKMQGGKRVRVAKEGGEVLDKK